MSLEWISIGNGEWETPNGWWVLEDEGHGYFGFQDAAMGKAATEADAKAACERMEMKQQMITAAQARDLNPKNAAEVHLREIYARIRRAAEEGKTSVRFPYELTEVKGEGAVSVKGHAGQAVKDQLVSLGFRILDHWECGQFVDAFLTIEWGEE